MAKKGFGDLTSSLISNNNTLSVPTATSLDVSDKSVNGLLTNTSMLNKNNVAVNAVNPVVPLRWRRESKSKRFNLLIRPSTFESIAKIAWVEESSINDLINHVLEEFVKMKRDVVEAYDKGRQ